MLLQNILPEDGQERLKVDGDGDQTCRVAPAVAHGFADRDGGSALHRLERVGQHWTEGEARPRHVF